jgi:hypothetical protein
MAISRTDGKTIADSSFIIEPFRFPNRRMIAMVEPGFKYGSIFGRGTDHALSLCDVSPQGLFAKDMLSGFQGGQGYRFENRIDCSITDNVNVPTTNNGLPAGFRLASKLLSE